MSVDIGIDLGTASVLVYVKGAKEIDGQPAATEIVRHELYGLIF